MNGGYGSSSPPGLRIPEYSASPSGSNNTNTGRPPLWTNSSQRKVSRLYLYTTLPLQKIIEVVHAKVPDAAPGKESANKKLNALLDKEPRWLHPRTESDMNRRLHELERSPTRSFSTRRSASPRPHSASDPQQYLGTPSNLAMKREAGTSPTTLDVPAFHQYPTAASAHSPSPTTRHPQVAIEQDSGPLSSFFRRETYMSSSTQGTTGSLQRVLAEYSQQYVQTVRRLVKRYTAPINHREESLSPISDLVGPCTSWLSDDDAPPSLANRPYNLPGDFLILDLLAQQQVHCFPNADEHIRRSCICFAKNDITESIFATKDGLTLEAQQLLELGITNINIDLGVCDSFNNTVLHFLAARGFVNHLMDALRSGRCAPILNARNTAGQTFLHVLHRPCFKNPPVIIQLLVLLLQTDFDIYTRDYYGRTFFHLLLADDFPPHEFNQLAMNLPNWSRCMTRDAFNVTPALQPEPTMGIQYAPTQAMDLDASSESRFPFSPEVYPEPVQLESELVRIVRSGRENPVIEHTQGRNALHCLAEATLSVTSILKKYGMESGTPVDQKRATASMRNELDSSTKQLDYRLSLLDGLLQAGVDPNHYDENGVTPLMAFAALLPEDNDYKVGPKVLARLIEAGAEVNARNRAGETALHIAVRCGRKLAMRTLAQHGACVHARDAAGRSLLEVTDVKMRATRGENPKEYAHYEACRAWLSGSKAMAVQQPTVLQEWGPVAKIAS